jgi:hypothetical protein
VVECLHVKIVRGTENSNGVADMWRDFWGFVLANVYEGYGKENHCFEKQFRDVQR